MARRTDEQRRTGAGGLRGFSLLEVMVSMVLLSIAGTIVAFTFQKAFEARNTAMARLDVAENSRSVLQVMAREIRSAYVNDDGYTTNREWADKIIDQTFSGNIDPFYRFDGGRHRAPIDREIPNDGKDNDGDGRIDEIQMRFVGRAGWRGLDESQFGYDEDGDGLKGEDGAYSLLYGINQFEFSHGIDDDQDGLIDEDGIYPADRLDFVVTRGGGVSEFYDLSEVGYCIGIRSDQGNHQTKLFRRLATAEPPLSGGAGGETVVVALDGQFLGADGRDANETSYTTLFYSQGEFEGLPEYETNKVDILGFDIVGLEIRYCFYNYAIAQELSRFPVPGDLDSVWLDAEWRPNVDIDNDGDGQSGEDPPGDADGDGNPDDDFDGRIDEDPRPIRADLEGGPWQWVRGNWESSIEVYPNEPADVRNADAHGPLFDAPDSVNEEVRREAAAQSDGLPDLVELRVYVLDRARFDPSVRTVATRVRIPATR